MEEERYLKINFEAIETKPGVYAAKHEVHVNMPAAEAANVLAEMIRKTIKSTGVSHDAVMMSLIFNP